MIRIPGKPLTKINSACKYGDKSSIVKLQNNVEKMKTANSVFFLSKKTLCSKCQIYIMRVTTPTCTPKGGAPINRPNIHSRKKERKGKYMHFSNTFDNMFKN